MYCHDLFELFVVCLVELVLFGIDMFFYVNLGAEIIEVVVKLVK